MKSPLIEKDFSIFVAGHNGMVGSAICRALKRNNYTRILTINKSDLDLTDSLAVDMWFRKNKPDVVIMAAAKVGGIYANNSFPTEFLLENLKIQINVIESAWKNKTRRLLFLGSSCIYPRSSPQPIKEDYLLRGELEKTNEAYAIAKISGIKLCSALRNQYGFDAISLMPTNLYGPGDNYHLINSHVMAALIRRFIEAKENNHSHVTCWGSGSPEREFLHVDDLGDATVFVLESWSPKKIETAILNVGTGSDLTIKKLASKISKATKFEGDILWDKSKPDGTPKKLLDITKILKLGWKPKININKGIELTINDYISRLDSGSIRL